MKNLFYLFLAVTMFACSGGGDGSDNQSSGTLSGTYQTNEGDSGTWNLSPIYVDGSYTEYSGEIVSDLYGTEPLEGWTSSDDSLDLKFFADNIGDDDSGEMPTYTLEADIDYESGVFYDTYFSCSPGASSVCTGGSFTGTKN